MPWLIEESEDRGVLHFWEKAIRIVPVSVSGRWR